MPSGLAVALGGGGARAAYQAGVVRRIGRAYPDLRPAVLVGESAGAITGAHLAVHPGSFSEATVGLAGVWQQLTTDRVFRMEGHWLLRNALRWAVLLVSGGWRLAPEDRGLLDTAPVRSLLEAFLGAMYGEIVGVGHNLEDGNLQAIALTAIDYATGETVTWS